MNYRDSAAEQDFRDRLRQWLEPHADTRKPRSTESTLHDQQWHRALYDGGWLGLTWPPEYGGRGLPDIYESILNDEIGAAAAPALPAEINFLARAIIGFGTDEQKRRFLPPMLSGEELWCQGFSEPDAGSDLAALRSRAVPEGGFYRLNGQKLWTSGASDALWCLVLARTDPDVPKHKGISCLIVSMSSPGVSVRPVRQISGSQEFAEVFFDDVRVPEDQRVGAEGAGWSLAMTTVAYERGPSDIGYISSYRQAIRRLDAAVAAGLIPDDPGTQELIAGCYVDVEVLRLQVMRSLSARAGHAPGAEGSVDKIIMARTEQRLAHVAMTLLGGRIALGSDPEWFHDYLWSRAATIYGGTEQVQLDILADRVLGMPRGR
jgi:alkylation response protein AidB-like acyl-CoA dehydrogenase